jgi:hypothetical protein
MNVMGGSLNDDEQFVMESLSSSFGGAWRPGEDPPDAYLMQGNVEVALELSTLTQNVVGTTGTLESRLSQDIGVLRICDELDEELGDLIGSASYAILTLHAPVDKLRKFRSILKGRIIEIVNAGTAEDVSLDISGNNVNVHVVKGQRPSGKKVVGIVANQNSNPNISSNVDFILSHRIQAKTQKCSKVTHRPLWLALFNDYWLAELNSYRYAMQQYSERHPFGKILLISGNREVHSIYET